MRRHFTFVAPALVGCLLLPGCGQGGSPPGPECSAALPGRTRLVISPEQAQNATTIAGVGKRLGLPDHAVTVALVTALQESGLRNLRFGDRDSLGLFQQRPSQGWGTAADILVPRLAAAAFYGRLRQVPGWQTLAVTEAAQAVQHSAAPGAYAQWESQARVLAGTLTGEFPAGLVCAHLGALPVLRDTELRAAAGAELGSSALSPAGRGAVWTTACWLVAHAAAFGVHSVVAGTLRWDAATGAWRTTHAPATGVSYG